MKKLLLLAMLFGLSVTTYTCAQAKETQKERFQATHNASKALVESQQYKFVGEVVYTNKDREKLSEDSNTIVISTSKISGKVTSISFDNKTFDVNGTIENYKVSTDDDKQQIAVTFKVKTASRIFNVYIDIKPNGNAFLTFATDDHNTISWTGKLKS